MDEKKRRVAPMRDRLDVDDIIRRVEQGETYQEIADALKVGTATVYRAIEAAGEEAISAHARAREASAEAWLDRGLAVVESALSKEGGIDASAARAYAQECARRAGEIVRLARQVSFLLPGGVLYIADFVYRTKDGADVVEDAKGLKTAAYGIKKRQMRAIHQIEIREV